MDKIIEGFEPGFFRSDKWTKLLRDLNWGSIGRVNGQNYRGFKHKIKNES